MFDADTGTNQVGATLTNTAIQVADGLFTASLDFGSGIFTGPARWLDIGVRTNGVGDFTLLSPRQLLAPTPYAIMANTASNLLGTLPAGQLSGTIANSQLPANLARLDGDATFAGAQTFTNAANSFTGNGEGLTELNATALASGTVADERLSSNVAVLNAHQTFTGSNLFSGAVQLTNTDNTLVGTFNGSGSALTGLNPTNLVPGMAAIDISGNAATATTAASATTADSATTAATADSATTFTGPLAGDVTGNQNTTVVASVGSQSAANVATGVSAANAATAANTPDTIVKRDSAGNFAAGSITAVSISGEGSGLSALNASALTSGTVADERLSANVALLNVHQTFTGSNLFSGVVQLTNTENTFAGTFAGNGSSLTGLNPTNLALGTAGIDISGNAATATTAGAAPWSGISGIPAGFADGVDHDTLYSAGTGLNLINTEFSVSFGGSGAAASAARSDHNHDSVYAALVHNHDATYSPLGHAHAAADITSGTLSDQRLSSNVTLLNAHQTFSGSNSFAGVNSFTNATNTFVGTFGGDGSGLSNVVVVAANVQGPLPTAQLTGPLPAHLLVGTYTNPVTLNNPLNSFTGDGTGLTGVNAASLEGLGAASFWQLGGNAGTTPGVDFLGTTDTNALELKVNSERVFRFEPTTNCPNLIGGWSSNAVDAGVWGATIGGGGANYAEIGYIPTSFYFTNQPNRIMSTTNANWKSHFATVGGGIGNTIRHFAALSTISGGGANSIGKIGGETLTIGSTIGGGLSNSIPGGKYSAGIFHTISGGQGNKIAANSFCTIGGGSRNLISIDNEYSSIGGGSGNFIDASGATISGGSGNAIDWIGPTFGNAIGGGTANYIAAYDSSNIGGGQSNRITGNGFSVIAGGKSNQVTKAYAVIPGGFNNSASGDYSFAAGRSAKALHAGSFVWADSTGSDFASITNDEFAVRASGGVRFETGGAGVIVDGAPLIGGVLTPGSVTSATIADGSVGSVDIADEAITTAKIAAGAVGSAAISDGAIVANDLDPSLLSGTFWRLGGNAGTTAGTDFLGTTDTNALELKVNNQRAFRLEPTTNSPNLIGGWRSNAVDAGVIGATIGGGGTDYAEIPWLFPNPYFTNQPNQILKALPVGTLPHFATVGGGIGNAIRSSALSTIGGGAANEIGRGGEHNLGNTIGGGVSNTIPGQYAAAFHTIAGGQANTISANDLSTIGGGGHNRIGADNNASTIGGGNGNLVDGSYATISGGSGNTIDWVGGNYGHAIGGGRRNYIVSYYSSAIGGGESNRVSGAGYSVVAGGRQNQVQTGFGTGLDGSATQGYSVVGGGRSNQVTKSYAVIPGGFNNTASGDYSFAAGNSAKALHTGAFVWAAGNTNDFPSQENNRFHVFAEGGMMIEYGGQDADGRGLKWMILASQTPGRVINVYNGAYLSEGGNWVDMSDRNAKENFEPVKPREVLEKVATLPLSKWNYRQENASVQHLGPVAQDFHAAFGLGADDKHIAALDSSGVALAAIQGLNQKLTEELKQKEAEIQSLQKRLEVLERAILGRETAPNGGGQ